MYVKDTIKNIRLYNCGHLFLQIPQFPLQIKQIIVYIASMKLLTIIFVLFPILTQAIVNIPPHLPEDQIYTDSNGDYKTLYNTPSLLNSSQYVLTYDDGPNVKITPQILDLLKKHKTKATFFVVSDNINNQTLPIIKRILDEGHTIGSHDSTHNNNNFENREVFKADLKRSLLKLNKIAKEFNHPLKQFYFRFPYAAYGKANGYHHMNVIYELSQELFNENCLHFVFWDNDSSDWVQDVSAQEIMTNFMSFNRGGDYYTYKVKNGKIIKVKESIPGISIPQIPGGGVILMHDMYQKTVEATKMLLENSNQNDIKIVPIYEVDEFSYPTSSTCRL